MVLDEPDAGVDPPHPAQSLQRELKYHFSDAWAKRRCCWWNFHVISATAVYLAEAHHAAARRGQGRANAGGYRICCGIPPDPLRGPQFSMAAQPCRRRREIALKGGRAVAGGCCLWPIVRAWFPRAPVAAPTHRSSVPRDYPKAMCLGRDRPRRPSSPRQPVPGAKGFGMRTPPATGIIVRGLEQRRHDVYRITPGPAHRSHPQPRS